MQELTIKQKLTNYYYFVIFYGFLIIIGSIAYWFGYYPSIYLNKSELTDWLAITYIISMHFFIMALMVIIGGVIVLPTIYLSGNKKFIIQTFFTVFFLGVLYFDIIIFQGGMLHILDLSSRVAINMFTNSSYLFTIHKIIAYIGALVLLGVIYRVNIWINKTSWFKNNKIGKRFIICMSIFSIVAPLIYYSASKERKQQLLAYIQYLPLCANSDEISNNIYNAYKVIKSSKLQYPLQPLQTTKITNPPNILIIAMDAWRADCFNKQDSPNLWGFAQQGNIFNNHFSGSNNTYCGLFSLFYGIPSNYFYKCLYEKQPSILITRLKQLNYQINFFNSWPEDENQDYMKILFGGIPNLYITSKGISSAEKDKNLTNNWLSWHASLDKNKPWFSFVFYDSLHGPDFPDNYSKIIKPAGKLRNYKKLAQKIGKDGILSCYKICVHYLDSLALDILTRLQKSNALANTIVIITADHGCELDDNNQDTWGYGCNFTKCQTQIPFAIILPDKYQQQLTINSDNLTTHYDIVPTLMKNFLGITNNIVDYSIGNNLLDKNNIKKQDWCLATYSLAHGSFIISLIENNKSLRINYNANYYLLDKFNRLIFNKTINTKYLDQALEYMTRFIKN